MLKAIIEKLEDVDEQYRGLYKKLDDGTFELQIDDSAALRRLKEFRDNNIDKDKKVSEYEKQLNELQERYKGVDLDKYKAGQSLLQQIQDDKERKLVEDGKWEDVFSMRTERMRSTHESDMAAKNKALEELEADRSKLRRSLGSMRIEQELAKAINDTGVKPRKGAMTDIMHRTHATFSVSDDGTISPMVNGSVVRGAKGEPLSMKEHIQSLASDATFLFEGGGGGGAGGSGDGAPRTAAGKIVLDPNDFRAAAKYSKELQEGTAVYADDPNANA